MPQSYLPVQRALVRQANPSWSPAQIEAAAKKQFNTAATDWFVQTLEACKALRPYAKWGYYGLPYNDPLADVPP